MQIRIGDEVSFLSEKLDGKVTSIIDANSVNVYCDVYGFEIPASVNDLVVTRSSLSQELNNTTNNILKQSSINTESSNSVFIAFVPDNYSDLQRSLFDLFIVNDTDHTILYSVASNNGEIYSGISAGNINPNSQLQLGTYTLKDIEAKFKSIIVQCLKYTKRSPTWSATIDNEVKISISSLCKSGAYQQSKYFKNVAFIKDIDHKEPQSIERLIESITPESTPKISGEKISAKELKAKIAQDTRGNKTVKEEKSVNPNIIEIDLHANALLETTAGMDSAAILEFQMEVFVKTMEKYKLRKGQKIVFIHGKGEGVLRQRIMWLLQTTYKRHNHQDASFKQYGFGATMVTIR